MDEDGLVGVAGGDRVGVRVREQALREMGGERLDGTIRVPFTKPWFLTWVA